MRTARALTIGWGGGVPARGGCTCQGDCTCQGVYLPGGCTCLGVYLPGGCTCLGMYLLGGVPAWGCTCPGVYLPGGCVHARRVYLPGGVPAQGGTCPGTPPSPWTEFLTHASENITLTQTSFAGGKNCSPFRTHIFVTRINYGKKISSGRHLQGFLKFLNEIFQ